MSPPLLRKARAVLDAGDLGVPLLRRLLETETVRLRSTSFASEGPFLAFNHRNCRECGGLATRTGPLIRGVSRRAATAEPCRRPTTGGLPGTSSPHRTTTVLRQLSIYLFPRE